MIQVNWYNDSRQSKKKYINTMVLIAIAIPYLLKQRNLGLMILVLQK